MAEVACPNCGHRNPLGANFCSSCGTQLEAAADGDPTTVSFVVVDGATEVPDEDDIAVELDELPSEPGVLVVKRGPNAGSRFALTKQVTTAGRHPDSDIFLDDITVSRRHAEVVQTPAGFVVRDVGSLNGTYLNRERVEESPLANGDEVQIGKYKLVFVAGRPHRSESHS